MRISINGNIGTGKTTLINNLSNVLINARVFKEDLDTEVQGIFYKVLKGELPTDNRIEKLNQFSFMAETAKRDIKSYYDDSHYHLFDRGIDDHVHVFAYQNMNKQDYMNYNIIQERILSELKWQPYHLSIVLTSDLSSNIKRIKKRGRDTEKNMPIEYLQGLAGRYDDVLERGIRHLYASKVVVIDVTDKTEEEVLAIALDKIDFYEHLKD